MKKILLLLILIAIAAVNGMACGVPEAIWGRTMAIGFPARVELREKGTVVQTALTSPFGWYRFEPVLPCSAYEVVAAHKIFLFQSATVLPIDFPGTGAGVRRDLGIAF